LSNSSRAEKVASVAEMADIHGWQYLTC